MCLFIILKRKMILRRKIWKVPWWRTLVSLSVSTWLFMQRYFLSKCVPSARNWGRGLLALLGGWLRLGSHVWAALAWWLDHSCHSMYGDHYYYRVLRNGTAGKFLAAKAKKKKSICPSLILALALLGPVPARYSQCSACLTQFWRPAARRVNKSSPVGLLAV